MILAFLWSLLGIANAAAGGDLVNNGGGAAEKNFLFAYTRIETFARPCLMADSCNLTPSEREILEKILSGLPEEYKTAEQIQFVSEKKNPGFFIIDGQLKIAKTGNRTGDPIYVNIDLLYPRNARGVVEPMGPSDALAILIHEMGHHHSSADHTALDLLGAKVTMLFQQQVYTTPLLPQKSDISAIVINPANGKTRSDVLLNVLGDTYDIGSAIEKRVYCSRTVIPIPIGGVPDIPVAARKAYSFRIHNLYWDEVKENSRSGRFVIKSNLTVFCKKTDTFKDAVTKFKLKIAFDINKSADPKNPGNTIWKFNTDSLEIKQQYDPWWKLISLPFLPGDY